MNCNCNNTGLLGGVFGGNGEILFFIILFCLLFTNAGCGCNR